MLRNIGLLLFLMLMLQSLGTSQDFDPGIGKALFKNKCASCHNKNMKDDLTGPALGGWEERWADYPQEDFNRWIRNSQAMINTDAHPLAVELWNNWKPVTMSAFPNLTDEDIGNIMAYVSGMYDGSLLPKKANDQVAVGNTRESGLSFWVYAGILILLVFLVIILSRVIANLNRLQSISKGGQDVPITSLWNSIFTKKAISFILFALVVLGSYYTANSAINLGRQQNYEPDQPIKFSHETHAGLHKIDCQYCHDGARRSRHSVIPSANTCLNCHKAIKKGSKYGTAEITKIYASIGFDPVTDKYVEDYENMSQEDVAELYKNWIGYQYKKDNGLNALDEKGNKLVEDQWEGVVTSLTNEFKPNVQGPIEWIRVHNLPDHVYYNHAQHVVVGKLECQECHGKIEEMAVVSQHSPLSMGWCVNCHRDTEVQFESNEYYNSYKKYHEQLSGGKRDRVTVEDIGGLECQKCHY